jgi:hypothetical protein
MQPWQETVQEISHDLADVRLTVYEVVGLLQKIHAEIHDQDAQQNAEKEPHEFAEYISAEQFHSRTFKIKRTGLTDILFSKFDAVICINESGP